MTPRQLRDLRLDVEARIAALRESRVRLTMSVGNGVARVNGEVSDYDPRIKGSRSQAILAGLKKAFPDRVASDAPQVAVAAMAATDRGRPPCDVNGRPLRNA